MTRPGKKLQGVLFDMDGTLFDTETIGMEVSRRVIGGMGYSMADAFYLTLLGGNAGQSDSRLQEEYGPGFDLAEFNRQWHQGMGQALDAGGVPKKQGVDALLRYLADNGYKMAVASATPAPRVVRNLEQAGIARYFGAVIGGDMVKNGKPDPEIFLAAAAALSLEAGQCLAVEDSFSGVRSAHAAGCITVMVPDLVQPNEEIRRLCYAVVPALPDIPAVLKAYTG